MLWSRMSADCDLVNGYKISRADPLHRIVIGRVYHYIVSILFGLKLRDVDCDFRLMRRTIFERINLEKRAASSAVEMMKRFRMRGSGLPKCRCITIPVRSDDRSSSTFRRLFRTGPRSPASVERARRAARSTCVPT